MKCHCCNGSGNEEPLEDGERLKGIRISSGLKLMAVASAMKITPSYLSMLESGDRRWTANMRNKFNTAIKGLVP